MKDFEVADVELSLEIPDIEKRILDAYQIILSTEDDVESIKSIVFKLLNTEIDICHILELVDETTEAANAATEIVTEMPSKLTSALSTLTDLSGFGANLKVSIKLLDFPAVGIILKKFEILKLEIEKIVLVLQRLALEKSGDVLKKVADGAGSTLIAPINAILASLSSLVSTINTTVMGVLNSIITLISTNETIYVGPGQISLFQTPKLAMKQDIPLINANFSAVDILSPVVENAISTAQGTITAAKGKIKETNVFAQAAASSALAAAGSFSFDGMGDIFSKFDPKSIKSAVDVILQANIVADPLPKYEQMSTSLGFMQYLSSGFEPKAKLLFGIPGQP